MYAPEIKRRDVFKIESILADAGDLDFAGTNGPAGYGLYTLDDGVRLLTPELGAMIGGALAKKGIDETLKPV